jgi:penicillin-insensitive murein DD-endopeptidase
MSVTRNALLTASLAIALTGCATSPKSAMTGTGAAASMPASGATTTATATDTGTYALRSDSFARHDPWARFTTPTKGAARSIGTYAAGCLAGGVALPLTGSGYQVMRPSRDRYYGHPNLVRFIKDLGKRNLAAGNGTILIGDMGQPRGGPAPSGHASHQIGLDVDIWLSQPAAAQHRSLTMKERETISAHSMVTPDLHSVSANWNSHAANIIKLTAQSPQVERLFVNPAIKQELCREYPGADWLHKVRPWWLHRSHEHVRLYGPTNDPLFHAQAPIPPGDGCDEGTFRYWFHEEAAAAAWKASHPNPPEQRKMPVLPAACEAVLKAR